MRAFAKKSREILGREQLFGRSAPVPVLRAAPATGMVLMAARKPAR